MPDKIPNGEVKGALGFRSRIEICPCWRHFFESCSKFKKYSAALEIAMWADCLKTRPSLQVRQRILWCGQKGRSGQFSLRDHKRTVRDFTETGNWLAQGTLRAEKLQAQRWTISQIWMLWESKYFGNTRRLSNAVQGTGWEQEVLWLFPDERSQA